MALTNRVRRLERRAGPRIAAPCATCGAPAGGVPVLSIRHPDGHELMPTCGACKFPLMSNGRAVYALPPGSSGKVLVLSELPPV